MAGSGRTVSEARIGSGATVLVLDVCTPARRHPDAVLVTIHGSGLAASLVVHAYDVLEILASFVEGLERSWRGWEGERVYESPEGDLRVVARHQGHVVRLAVRLGSRLPREPWSVEATVSLEPGEELRRAARDVADLLSSREPPRTSPV